jgi:hypothetical protein
MKALKLFVRLLVGPVIWLRNILYERIYTSSKVLALGDFESLTNNGFQILPERIGVEELDKLKADFLALRKRKPFDLTGQLAGRVYEHGPISQLAKCYVEKFQPIAEAYFGSKRVRCELSMYQKSWPKCDVNDVPGGEFHEDDNKRNLKFFIYLSDVTEDNGPFCYVPKTHGLRKPEKYIRWLLWEIFHARRFLYSYRLDKMQCELDEVKVTGPAGVVFCADTTGYHRASAPLAGEREVFVVSYTRK